jgi:hypothetical protein
MAPVQGTAVVGLLRPGRRRSTDRFTNAWTCGSDSIVTLAHKMLRIIFAVLKNKAPYRDKAVDYEAMSVQRNAPRWMTMLIKHGYMPTPA